MEPQQLQKFKTWFDQYVKSFYGDNDYINANLKMKEDHSRRVCEEMLVLADELNLSDEQKRTAETIALFHDIGRFRQFVEYRTYNDPRSVNHCLLGLEILREKKVLDDLEKAEKQIIEQAVQYHGVKELPSELNGNCLFLTQMVRDADKIDIFYVVIEYYKQCRDNPDQVTLEIELPQVAGYSRDVVKNVLAGKRIDYKDLKTMNDMRLIQLSWMYDVNFLPTLKCIAKRGYIETLFDFLPRTDDIAKVRTKIFDYINSRIQQES